ncbi:OmpP1/FadL family transporter [Rhizobium sp. RAF56]|uniref:OmpP1/FadL family transporter n=1 Tax=Rhizobium sp. RAF56 TaxID=3233062 RepID=UPI003F9C31FF
MVSRIALKGVLTLAIGASFAQTALAGGLERGGYDIDLLFDKSRYAFEAGVTYVMPDRKLKNAKDVNPQNGNLNNRSSSARDTENYAIPYGGAKIGITDDVDCLVDYSQPFGAHSNPGLNWAGANSESEIKLSTDNYGATCSYKFDAGKGQVRLIGGTFYQTVDGDKEALVVPVPGPAAALYNGVGHLHMEDSAWGWRGGVAYEIPEYAFRTSLVYNSQVKYDDLTGTLDLRQVPSSLVNPKNQKTLLFGRNTAVYGEATAPDSLELKFQTGIAPEWLAFGSVKWTNWSTMQSIAFCPTSTKGKVACKPGSAATSLDLLYQDGWTVTGGIGHQFNEQWSGALSLTWDRGTSTDIGISSDSWTMGAGVSYKPTKQVELLFAGALGVLTSGHSGTVTKDGVVYGGDVTYDYGNDIVGALSTSLKVRF